MRKKENFMQKIKEFLKIIIIFSLFITIKFNYKVNAKENVGNSMKTKDNFIIDINNYINPVMDP